MTNQPITIQMLCAAYKEANEAQLKQMTEYVEELEGVILSLLLEVAKRGKSWAYFGVFNPGFPEAVLRAKIWHKIAGTLPFLRTYSTPAGLIFDGLVYKDGIRYERNLDPCITSSVITFSVEGWDVMPKGL